METTNRFIEEAAWTTKAGLEAKVLIIVDQPDNRKRHRCGYVAVPVDHPLNGVDRGEQVPAITQDMVDNITLGKRSAILIITRTLGSDGEGLVRRSPDILFDVHGGLTFSGAGESINLPGPSWWFGFDCAHAGDGVIEPSEFELKYNTGAVVRTLEFCKEECESLAKQIVELYSPKLLEDKSNDE